MTTQSNLMSEMTLAVHDIVAAARPLNVDPASITTTGEGVSVTIVLIPHARLGGLSLVVWLDPDRFRLLWAHVTDLSYHDEIDLGVVVEDRPCGQAWAENLATSLSRELSRPIIVDVPKRWLRRPQARCRMSVGTVTTDWWIGRVADPSAEPQTTSLAKGALADINLPVPIEEWRKFAS